MREALGMSLDTPTDEAIKKFWLLGEFLDLGVPQKNEKVDPELEERQKLLDDYKFQIANLKKKLQNDKDLQKLYWETLWSNSFMSKLEDMESKNSLGQLHSDLCILLFN